MQAAWQVRQAGNSPRREEGDTDGADAHADELEQQVVTVPAEAEHSGPGRNAAGDQYDEPGEGNDDSDPCPPIRWRP